MLILIGLKSNAAINGNNNCGKNFILTNSHIERSCALASAE
jgi:hypothetical protein